MLAELIEAIEPHPDGQGRVFRIRLRPGGTRCVLKVDLAELEAVWMPEVSSRGGDVVPHVRAHGRSLGPLDVSWIVMDDLPYRGRSDSVDIAREVMVTTARFHRLAADIALPSYPIDVDFVRWSAESALGNDCPGPVSDVIRRAEMDDAWLRSLGGYVVGHGDVHFWNAVSERPEGPWRLIDPIPRTAHWAWDAAYAQMTSGVPETPDLIRLLGEERDRLGLPTPGRDEIERISVVLLGWTSMLWWALLPHRRADVWWAGEVQRHVRDLACLGDHP